MPPRNRYQDYPTPKGKVVTGGNLAAGGNYSVSGGHSYCADITGPGDCTPFHVQSLTISGGRVNVFNDPNNYWENYLVDFLETESFSHLPSEFGQDQFDVDYATQAVARTNPSRPYVDIPVNILELGDIARTIRREGLNILNPRVVGRQNLRYQFGLAPLIGDLVKLTQFQDVVNHRIREVERLRGPTGLRRTLNMGAWSNQASYSRVMQSNQYFWTDIVRQVTYQTIRAHVRWNTDADTRGLRAADVQRLAMRAALGGTIDNSTLWEAMPWSWLIDWCSNIGQFIATTRNIIPATLSGVHIMRETLSRFETDGGTNSPIRVVLHDKTRAPSFVAPIAHFPFLSGGQMGILASLAVTRR